MVSWLPDPTQSCHGKTLNFVFTLWPLEVELLDTDAVRENKYLLVNREDPLNLRRFKKTCSLEARSQ